MKLYPGMEAEYEKRHNELWPEMQDMIHEYGGRNYTIFLDRETLILYGYIEIEDVGKWDESEETTINRNGGISWRISWRQIWITARCPWICRKYFIWIKQRAEVLKSE